MNQLTSLMNPLHNFAAYRSTLKDLDSQQPYIPYLGVFLNDFIFLDETDVWQNGALINFEKIKSLGGHLKEFEKIRKKSDVYKIRFNASLEKQDYLLSAEIWDENDILHLSKMREDASLSGKSFFFEIVLIPFAEKAKPTGETSLYSALDMVSKNSSLGEGILLQISNL